MGQVTVSITPSVLVYDAQATAAAEAAAQSEQGRLAGPTLLPPSSEPYVCLTDHCRVRANPTVLMALMPQLRGPGVTYASVSSVCTVVDLPLPLDDQNCLQLALLYHMVVMVGNRPFMLPPRFASQSSKVGCPCIGVTVWRGFALCNERTVPAWDVGLVMTYHCAAGRGAASRRLGRLGGGGVRADHVHARRGLPPRVRAVEPAAPEPAAHQRRAPQQHLLVRRCAL